jgi:hypothetical protein
VGGRAAGKAKTKTTAKTTTKTAAKTTAKATTKTTTKTAAKTAQGRGSSKPKLSAAVSAFTSDPQFQHLWAGSMCFKKKTSAGLVAIVADNSGGLGLANAEPYVAGLQVLSPAERCAAIEIGIETGVGLMYFFAAKKAGGMDAVTKLEAYVQKKDKVLCMTLGGDSNDVNMALYFLPVNLIHMLDCSAEHQRLKGRIQAHMREFKSTPLLIGIITEVRL